MTVKCTGAEFKAYMDGTDPKWWPEGSYIDDEEITVDGVPFAYEIDYNLIPDYAEVRVTAGSFNEEGKESTISAETHLRRWLKAQSTVTLVIQFPKTEEGPIRTALEAHNIKIL